MEDEIKEYGCVALKDKETGKNIEVISIEVRLRGMNVPARMLRQQNMSICCLYLYHMKIIRRQRGYCL